MILQTIWCALNRIALHLINAINSEKIKLNTAVTAENASHRVCSSLKSRNMLLLYCYTKPTNCKFLDWFNVRYVRYIFCQKYRLTDDEMKIISFDLYGRVYAMSCFWWTTRHGKPEWRTTYSLTLPIMARLRALRPLEPITIMSAFSSIAVRHSASPGLFAFSPTNLYLICAAEQKK